MIRVSFSSLLSLTALVIAATALATTAAPAPPKAPASTAAPSPTTTPTPPTAKLPPPTIFPAPGTYSNTTSLSLRDEVPGTEIHYTWDGTEPTASSPLYDQHEVLFIEGVYDGDKGLRTDHTLRAVATKGGMAPSEPVTFSYKIERRDRTAYLAEEVAPGVRMIRDSDNDKMFLVRGSKRFALIDSGMGRGDLRNYLSQFTGGLPLVVIFTHSHGDHIGQADQFIAQSTEYVGAGDRDVTADFLQKHGATRGQIASHLKTVTDGSKVDLGDRALEIVTIRGHTPGSIVILDPESGNLFTGDTVGNNSNLPPDVLWMQGLTYSLDQYFAAVRTGRKLLGDRVKLIMTGHNDRPLVGTAYLDNLEAALQRAMDEGNEALIPSYRPQGLKQIVVGDRLTDPNWFGINVNAQTFLPAPRDQIASLTLIDLQGATLTTRFTSTNHDYKAIVKGSGPITIAAMPASSRVQSLTVNDETVQAGTPVDISFKGKRDVALITVTAHDGQTTDSYRVILSR
ncbi:MAG: MBL fold metallo-hydrolase [Proteobacteria bacterium]|nr:MBL fold metallo-hydrolase [Pseudomonadota bacterium]